MLIDYHLHTDFTSDAIAKIKDYCIKAAELGFSEICITNHHEFRPDIDKLFKMTLSDSEWNQSRTQIKELRKEYPMLKIKLGVELGYHEACEKEIKEFAEKFPFDYILGSIHNVDGYFYSASIEQDTQYSTQELYANYYNELKKMIKLGQFDCIGHLDVCKKHLDPIDYQTQLLHINEIIKLMKQYDKGFEINTSGWSYDCQEQYPSIEIIKLIYKAGIRKVTIGSDSHKPDTFGYGIKKAIQLLKDVGYTEICTFEKRKPIYNKF